MIPFYNIITAFALIFLLMTACNSQAISQQTAPPVLYFEETGYTVQAEFLYFFERYGGLESLGYPLSTEIMVDGWRVQYFAKGRLEYHPENEAAYRVTVGWLGDLLNRRRPPLSDANIPAGHDSRRRYYPLTGHSLSADFLMYFEKHGGTVRFGLPISEPYLWEGQLTQDFQSARFMWSPLSQERVILENIGAVHLQTLNLQP